MRPTLLAAILLAATAATAGAQPDEAPVATDPTERPYLALGASRALSEVAGPAGLFRMTDTLDLDVIAGIVKFSGDTEPSSAFGLMAGVRHTLTRRGAVGLSVGGRVGFAHVGGRMGVDGQTTWLLEAPARIELAATPWLRIHVEGGLAIAIEPGIDGGIEGGGTEGSTAWMLGASGLAAGAGFAIALDR